MARIGAGRGAGLAMDTSGQRGEPGPYWPGMNPRALAALLTALLVLLPGSVPAQPTVWTPLINRLAGDGLDRTELVGYFAAPEVAFNPAIMADKVDRMVRKQFEPKPPPTQRTLEQTSYGYFLKPWVLAWANEFAQTHADTLSRAEAKYGVPSDVVVALLLVETKLGTYLGKDNALPSLASMAISNSLESIRPYLKTVGASPERAAFAEASARDRAEWAYQELKAFILYAQSLGQNPLEIPGSIYGAIGICQFMPTNIARYGATPRGDGKVDLLNVDDAIFSVANYLVGHGWKPGLSYEGRKNVIYSYNHSELYVLGVLTVADLMRQARGEPPLQPPKP